MFEEDQGLINTEINLYIQLGRTEELIGKLSEAINLDDENDLLYLIGGLYLTRKEIVLMLRKTTRLQ